MAPDAFYLGRYFDYETGRDGPKLQMSATELIIIIGRNRSEKDAGIGNYNALRLRRASEAVWFHPRWRQRNLAGLSPTLGRPMSSIYSASQIRFRLTMPSEERRLGGAARYRASDLRLFDYAAWDGEALSPWDKQN